MSHIDALVNDESKRSIIGARVAKLAQEGYQIVLNLKHLQQRSKVYFLVVIIYFHKMVHLVGFKPTVY